MLKQEVLEANLISPPYRAIVMSGNLKTLDIRILKAVPGYRRAFQVDAALTPLHILDEASSQPKMSMHLKKELHQGESTRTYKTIRLPCSI